MAPLLKSFSGNESHRAEKGKYVASQYYVNVQWMPKGKKLAFKNRKKSEFNLNCFAYLLMKNDYF